MGSMRYLLILCLSGSVAFCGPLGVGVKAGVAATELVMASYHSQCTSCTSGSRFVVGPAVDIRLPCGLGIEVDALYRHVNNPSNSSLEIPILAKFHIPVRGRVTPYVVGGGTIQWNNLLRAKQVGPLETISGSVFGVGAEAKMDFIRIGPEIRYTRWRGEFDYSGGRLVHRNQLEVLVGFTF
jgi:hypothetical protein